MEKPNVKLMTKQVANISKMLISIKEANNKILEFSKAKMIVYENRSENWKETDKADDYLQHTLDVEDFHVDNNFAIEVIEQHLIELQENIKSRKKLLA